MIAQPPTSAGSNGAAPIDIRASAGKTSAFIAVTGVQAAMMLFCRPLTPMKDTPMKELP
jgi:hypothetical protein